MEENPVRATQLGIDGHDDRLGEFTAADYERRARNDDAWYERFAALADADLTGDERIDRDLVISTLRGRQIVRDWEAWKRDPATYLGPSLSGVFALFLNRIHDEPDLVEYATARRPHRGGHEPARRRHVVGSA